MASTTQAKNVVESAGHVKKMDRRKDKRERKLSQQDKKARKKIEDGRTRESEAELWNKKKVASFGLYTEKGLAPVLQEKTDMVLAG